ncbi:hypothetical protein [Streptomyces sp. NPDC127033]|uniref:hypothetical protein n=1 Tax=Streptomyces sp. NPDC127033 TaxID=3347110 RepID=UPI003663FCC9
MDQQFWVSRATEIRGAGGICGDAGGRTAQKCTEVELEKAAKADDLRAKVMIKDGVTLRVTEER